MKTKHACIRVRNARQNNLKGIDVDIPLNAITVITGPSGSGKSTLAIELLASEGQRRYMDTLGLDSSSRRIPSAPLVDDIFPLPPAVAMPQRGFRNNPRSTLFTFTGISRFTRLLFGRCAAFKCPDCGIPVKPVDVEEIVDDITTLDTGARINLLAPLTGRFFGKMNKTELIDNLVSAGFTRLFLNGKIYYIEDVATDLTLFSDDAAIVVDRIVCKDGILSRTSDSVRLALKFGEGVIRALVQKERNAPVKIMTWVATQICPECRSTFPALSPDLFKKGSPDGTCKECCGSGCPACSETGFAKYVATASVHGKTFPEVSKLSLSRVADWCREMKQDKNAVSGAALTAHYIASAILERMESLENAGLGEFPMDRKIAELSDGEFQKLRLATLCTKKLSGALFILDEPSASIHPDDFPLIWKMAKNLRRDGNTIVMVEHVPWFITRADHVIELGQEAGRRGGHLLFQGQPDSLDHCPASVTAPWLKNSFSKHYSQTNVTTRLVIDSLQFHSINIKQLQIPLNALVCITGKNGSGKSILTRAIAAFLSDKGMDKPDNCRISLSFKGKKPDVILVDSMPAASNPRAMPVTYLKIFNHIRQLMAGTPEARARGIKPAWFLLNRKGGRCEECNGKGNISIDLGYMPSMNSTCRICKGKRYNRDTLSMTYKGRNMAEILAMSASDAASFFSRIPAIRQPLELLEDTGLGYLALGQPLVTLSGGESRRLKLARELNHKNARPRLYLMDNPLPGLHPSDVEKLVMLMKRLVEHGHSVIVSELREQFISEADHVIDLSRYDDF